MERITRDRTTLQRAALTLRKANHAQIDFPVWLAEVSAVRQAAEQVVLMRADDADDVKTVALECAQLTKGMLQVLIHKAAVDTQNVRGQRQEDCGGRSPSTPSLSPSLSWPSPSPSPLSPSLSLPSPLSPLSPSSPSPLSSLSPLSPSPSSASASSPTLECCTTPPAALMPVTIRTFVGATWRLSLSPTCTAQEAKAAVTCMSQQRIRALTPHLSDTPPANDALYVNGSRLADGDVLAAHGVAAGSLLHMVTF